MRQENDQPNQDEPTKPAWVPQALPPEESPDQSQPAQPQEQPTIDEQPGDQATTTGTAPPSALKPPSGGTQSGLNPPSATPPQPPRALPPSAPQPPIQPSSAQPAAPAAQPPVQASPGQPQAPAAQPSAAGGPSTQYPAPGQAAVRPSDQQWPQPTAAAGPAAGSPMAPPPTPPGYLPPAGASGPASAPGRRTGRSTWVIVATVAVAAILIGAGVSFLVTRRSGEDVVAGTTTSIDDTASSVGAPEEPTTAPEPLGAEQLSRSVVQIQLLLDGEPTCTGSGTVVDTVGTVVTNFHVVEQSPLCPHDTIGVAVAASSQSIPVLSYEADLLTFDSDLDLAVIRIARDLDGVVVTEQFEPIALGDSQAVALGDQLRVIGYPGIGGETVTFTTGSVSGFAETAEGGERSWLKTDATIAGGNSGGLAADASGRFVGIPTRVGSGSGEIVDCRVIADSNGDGRLDGSDSCVPIGGFINGIRPVALAVPLIAAAENAAPIDQGPPQRDEPMSPDLPQASNPTWTSAVDGEGRATDFLSAAQAGSPQLCLTWDFADVPPGTLSDAIWIVEGETIPEASVLDDPNDGDVSGSYFACISRDDGLLAGTYELVWLVDEQLVFAEAIIVGDGVSAVVEVFNDTDVPLCVVQFNPNGTSTYGLNELAEPTPPGESVTVEVGIGPLDARIIDCDGDIRIEDSTGFDVSEDLLVTVE